MASEAARAREHVHEEKRWEKWRSIIVYGALAAVFALEMVEVRVPYVFWIFLCHTAYCLFLWAAHAFGKTEDLIRLALSAMAAALVFFDLPWKYYLGALMVVALVAIWRFSDILTKDLPTLPDGDELKRDVRVEDEEVEAREEAAKTPAERREDEEVEEEAKLVDEKREREDEGTEPVHPEAPTPPVQ